MKNDLMVFQSQEFGEVRSVIIEDDIWFVGKDVAQILGYSNTRKAIIDHIDEDDKNTVTIRDGIKGNPNQVVINESGLYSLILSSKLPNAKKFKRWVTSEVLPAIRKQGFYMQDGLSKEVQAIFHLDRQQQKLIKEISDINNSVTEFKENMPLFAVECDCLNKEVKKRATECLGGYKSEAYNNKSLRSRVFADIYSEIRRQFDVTSYKGIKRIQYDKAINLVRMHKLPMSINEDIQDILEV